LVFSCFSFFIIYFIQSSRIIPFSTTRRAGVCCVNSYFSVSCITFLYNPFLTLLSVIPVGYCPLHNIFLPARRQLLKFQDDYTTLIATFKDFILLVYAVIDDLYQQFVPSSVSQKRNITTAKMSLQKRNLLWI